MPGGVSHIAKSPNWLATAPLFTACNGSLAGAWLVKVGHLNTEQMMVFVWARLITSIAASSTGAFDTHNAAGHFFVISQHIQNVHVLAWGGPSRLSPVLLFVLKSSNLYKLH